MKIRLAFILIAILVSCVSFGQDSLVYEWEEMRTYDIDSNEVWTVDRLENVYISKQSVINKYDTAGVLKFSQSIKIIWENASIGTYQYHEVGSFF